MVQPRRGKTFFSEREGTSLQGIRKLVNIKKIVNICLNYMYLFFPSFSIYISQFFTKKQEFVGKNIKGNIVGSSWRCLLKSLNYKKAYNLLLSNTRHTIKRTLSSYTFYLKFCASLRIQKATHDSVCKLQKY